jgi:hypothetical protein
MGVTTTNNKPFNPRGNDQSPKGYNRAKLYSGKALDFDGVNDYVKTPNMALQSTNVWTYSANVKIDTGSILAWYIFDTRASEATGQGAHFISTGQLQIFQVGDPSRISDFIFERNQWYKIDITSDASSVNLYINGVFSQSFAAFNVVSVSGGLTIGARFTNNYSLAGNIGGFKAFNVALTAAQVADLYNNPEKVVPTGVDNTALKLWLPMMEGAGTTAYDGSGNGNHGTIAGATYVNGIGAPVAQSAVMDWNKGSNIYSYSNEFDEWTKANATITADYAISPDGTQNATRVEMTPGGIMYISATGSSGDNTLSVWAKSTTGTGAQFRFFGNGNTISSGLQTTTDEWQRFEYTFTYSAVTAGIKGDDDILFFGFQHEISSEAGAYIPTIGNTTQPTPVLLPQGLTTGRDITGVNLFENVRKQGALNLDGNSWAEVHDNESLDFGTGSFSLEVWSKAKYISSGSIYNVLLTLGGNVSGGSTSSIYIDSSLNYTFRYDSTLIVAGGSSEGDWSHVVGVYDGTNINIYLNGSFVVQAAASATSKTNDLVKVIGRDSSGNSRAYKDQLAQPRIYNRALTASEIERNYNAGKNTYTN